MLDSQLKRLDCQNISAKFTSNLSKWWIAHCQRKLMWILNQAQLLSDCNWTRTDNHLVRKTTLTPLAKLTKWLSCVVSTYPYDAFDCMFLSCHVGLSEWIYTPYLSECQGPPCSKQVRYLKFKWLYLDWNPQPLTSSINTQPFGQTDHMIELCCEYLFVQCIWSVD